MEFEFDLDDPRENPSFAQLEHGKPQQKPKSVNISSSHGHGAIKDNCQQCKEPHSLKNCKTFAELHFHKKWNVIRITKICGRCLKKGHYSSKCDVMY